MEALQYEPLTGVFTWVLPPKKATRVRAGDIAGCSNRTGFLGVVPVPSRRSPRRFRAQVFVEGKPRNLGYYLTAEEAHGVYLKAKRELHEGCLL